jgi:peptide/nickel transport system permease protein
MATEHDRSRRSPVATRLWNFASRLRENNEALIGLCLLIPLLTMTLFAPTVAPHDPTANDIDNKFADPSLEHPFGTDNFGRDLFSRVLLGGQTTVLLGISGALLGLVLGLPIGLASGYYGGRVDEYLMRFMDLLMGIPTLLFALLIMTALSPSLWNVVFAIGIIFSPRIGRVIRSSTLSVKEEEFVQAAKARGESDRYIMFREILPNITGAVFVEVSIRVGYAMLIGASLSFLGLGTQPPAPDWGYMVAASREYMWSSPYPLLFPSLALMLTILGFNLLGDGLREIMDPRIETEGT